MRGGGSCVMCARTVLRHDWLFCFDALSACVGAGREWTGSIVEMCRSAVWLCVVTSALHVLF